MTEDPRISEIRAVLDELPAIEPHEMDATWRVADSRSKTCQRIRAIVDREAPARQADTGVRDELRRLADQFDARGRQRHEIGGDDPSDDDTCAEEGLDCHTSFLADEIDRARAERPEVQP